MGFYPLELAGFLSKINSLSFDRDPTLTRIGTARIRALDCLQSRRTHADGELAEALPRLGGAFFVRTETGYDTEEHSLPILG